MGNNYVSNRYISCILATNQQILIGVALVVRSGSIHTYLAFDETKNQQKMPQHLAFEILKNAQVWPARISEFVCAWLLDSMAWHGMKIYVILILVVLWMVHTQWGCDGSSSNFHWNCAQDFWNVSRIFAGKCDFIPIS